MWFNSWERCRFHFWCRCVNKLKVGFSPSNSHHEEATARGVSWHVVGNKTWTYLNFSPRISESLWRRVQRGLLPAVFLFESFKWQFDLTVPGDRIDLKNIDSKKMVFTWVFTWITTITWIITVIYLNPWDSPPELYTPKTEKLGSVFFDGNSKRNPLFQGGKPQFSGSIFFGGVYVVFFPTFSSESWATPWFATGILCGGGGVDPIILCLLILKSWWFSLEGCLGMFFFSKRH